METQKRDETIRALTPAELIGVEGGGKHVFPIDPINIIDPIILPPIIITPIVDPIIAEL
jgi:hypothetical protein